MGKPRRRALSAKAVAADPVRAYADAVVDGVEPAGQLLHAACARHLRDLETGADRGLRFDHAKAAQVIAFFAKLRHFKGEWAGQPITLQPFQAFQVGSLFGWVREADGHRRFRQAYLEEPRGQGKSTKAAGIALRLGLFDGEPAAEIYFVATKRDQARISWETARQIVLRVPALRQRVEAKQSHLYVPESASKLEPLGADADTLDGLRPHGVIADEIHAHKSSALLDVMTTGTGTRRQPLVFEITTAGVGQVGVCWDHHDYSSKVARGLVQDDSWFGCVIGADPDDDWTAPDTWRKANPNLGVSVKVDDMARKALQAQHIPAYESEFRRLHLGQWVQAAERYLPMAAWDDARNAAPVDREALRRLPCVIGLDVSSKFDFTAAVCLFQKPGGGYVVLPHFWLPEAQIAQARRALVPLDVWRRQGLLTTTPGDVVDQETVAGGVQELAREFRVAEVCIDPWNATWIATDLQRARLQVVEVRQGARSLSEPTKELAALVARGQLQHGGHPVLRWMADNLVVRGDANDNVAPDKSRANEKIDGIVALIMALSRRQVLTPRGSGLRERGLLVIGG